MPQLQFLNRGSQTDYVLGVRGEGWTGFDVVRWHAKEAISELFEYEITLVRDALLGPLDLESLLDSGATFRIATAGTWREVHGILAEVEEIDRTPALLLYRVLLVPHLWHAKYRRRCLTWRKRSFADVIGHVLENNLPWEKLGIGIGGLSREMGDAVPPDVQPDFSSFEEPRGTYLIDVEAESFFDPEYMTQNVQYNESDFAFVSRLLEREGMSYFFEHLPGGSLMTITDNPGIVALKVAERTLTLRRAAQGGSSRNQEIVRSFREGRRLRSRAVTVRGYSPWEPTKRMETEEAVTPAEKNVSGHFEFPYDVHSAPRLQRFEGERVFSTGSSTVRSLEPGYAFRVQDGDGLRGDLDVLAVAVEIYATQLLPPGTALDLEPFGFAGQPAPSSPGYENRFTVMPLDRRFRPEVKTPWPVIAGVQSAIVTAEEYEPGERPEINCTWDGCVRVRFHWDQRPEEKGVASSHFIYVSHYWAGPGFGAQHNPRVGQEVILAFREGNPNRPFVIGRKYSDTSPPPYDAEQSPTVSTVKSQSSPKAEGFNELRFEDLAKKEQIYLHAQRNLDEVVRASHSTSVGGDQSNSVGGNRTHTVHGWESVTVAGDRTTLFKSNEHHTVTGFQDTHIGANEDRDVKGWRNITVGVGQNVTVSGPHKERCVDYYSWASATHFFESPFFGVKAPRTHFEDSMSFVVEAAGCVLSMTPGTVVLSNGAGSTIALIGGCIFVIGGSAIMSTAGGRITQISGGPMVMGAGGDISAAAPTIKLNG